MSSGRRCIFETPTGCECRFYIDDMLGLVERVLEYTGGPPVRAPLIGLPGNDARMIAIARWLLANGDR